MNSSTFFKNKVNNKYFKIDIELEKEIVIEYYK
jgi:hypothetical protein